MLKVAWLICKWAKDANFHFIKDTCTGKKNIHSCVLRCSCISIIRVLSSYALNNILTSHEQQLKGSTSTKHVYQTHWPQCNTFFSLSTRTAEIKYRGQYSKISLPSTAEIKYSSGLAKVDLWLEPAEARAQACNAGQPVIQARHIDGGLYSLSFL